MQTVSSQPLVSARSGSREQAFVIYIADLVRRDRSARNALLRGLYTQPEPDPGMRPYIASWVSNCGPWAASAHYLTASLMTLHPLHAETGNLGTHMAALQRALQPRPGAVHNLQAQAQVLWQVQPADLPAQLHSLVLQCKLHRVPVHWSQLLCDLMRWEYARRAVVESWIAGFLAPGGKASRR